MNTALKEQMKKLLLFILLIGQLILTAQKNCAVTNKSFKSGEQLNYKIYYNWGAIWIAAGEASFNAYLTNLNGRYVYHLLSLGATYPQYDWFYKVRDKYESYVDTTSLKPLRFTREVKESSNYVFDDYVFDQRKNRMYTTSIRNKKLTKLDSINITSCTNDVMTAIFYARCLDFSKYKPKDSIPITFVLDGQLYPSYMTYLGKEIIHTELLGKVRCIKFSPRLVEGTIFRGGEGMIVWVTDDENKIPIYVETPIIIGAIKAKLINYTGLKNKINCLIPN